MGVMIVLVAYFSVKRENLDKVVELCRKMEEHSRREPGCRAYIAHQQENDPLRFCFYEAYDNDEAIEAHRRTSHYQQYVIDGLFSLIDHPTRERYRPLSGSSEA